LDSVEKINEFLSAEYKGLKDDELSKWKVIADEVNKKRLEIFKNQ
jgi:hypothetical protein